MRPARPAIASVLLAAALVGVAACGSSTSKGSPTPTTVAEAMTEPTAMQDKASATTAAAMQDKMEDKASATTAAAMKDSPTTAKP